MTQQAHDPTRLGASPIAGAAQAVRLSLSETQALCTKAARGAGFDWGHAEAAGHAAQWLAARGLPGCEMVLNRLRLDAMRPRAIGARHPAPLCPVHLGTALVDHARLPVISGQTVHALGEVAVPGLLLPFLATTARLGARALRLCADDLSLTFHADGTTAHDPALPVFCGLARVQLRVTFPHGTQPWTGPQTQTRTQPAELPGVPLPVWRALDAIALRVTVPASPGSASGAGSAGSDND